MANTFRIVNLGDSVPWGQGLREADKYDTLVQAALRPHFPGGVSLERFAHSGAVIGAGTVTGNPANGEVPVPRPSIIEQCDSFANSPGTVDLVLVNGGINDVGVAAILNPLALAPSLHGRIVAACHTGMSVLLKKVSAKFTQPSCKIRVTGYYTILSDQSDPFNIPRLLSVHGVAPPVFITAADLVDSVTDRCELFFNESTAQLKAAVAAAADPRITFVPSGFTDANAVFVPGTALLWGLDALLNPMDPVADQRRAQCNITFGQPLEVFHRELCYRTSAGHPNVGGALQFSRQILASL